MGKVTNIILGSTVGVGALVGAYLIIKRKSSTEADAKSSGVNSVPQTPAPKDDSAGLSNNYVIWSYCIMKTINDTYDSNVGALIGNQLNLAWNNSPAGIPSYNNDVALQIRGTVGDGTFALPTSIGTSTGKDNMLQTVYGNALILLTVAGKNIVQKKYGGQQIGKNQTILRNLYIAAQGDVVSASSIPASAANLIVAYNYLNNKNQPDFYNGSNPSPSAVSNVMSSASNNNAGILSTLK